MIKHIVMFKLLENDQKQANLNKMKAALEALPSKISEIKLLEIGLNFTESDRAFDAVLVSEFETTDHLKAYAIHPEHLKVVEFINTIKDKTIVVDYEF